MDRFNHVYLKKGPRIGHSNGFGFNGLISPPQTFCDYSFVHNFHQLTTIDGIMYLKQIDVIDNSLRTITQEELDNDYINLLEFLKNAKYIGKYGTRTKAANNGDRSYMNSPVLVLYQSPTHTIIYSEGSKIPFRILDDRYYNDWEFSGQQINTFSSPSKVYLQVLKIAAEQGERKLKHKRM